MVVNLVSVRLLDDEHTHEHEHNEDHHHHLASDHNLKAAYLHVLTDALTSVPVLVALLAGCLWDSVWMDALMGIVGSLLISHWAIDLLKDTSHILLDGSSDEHISEEIRTLLEADADNLICDLHFWQLSERATAAIISVVTHYPCPVVEHQCQLIEPVHELKHITIEVHTITDIPCIPVMDEKL